VEELIRRRDDVLDVAVVGYPDAKFGERACAFILITGAVDISLDVLATSLLDFGLSKEKLPERVVCVTEFPRSPDGKVLKGELRSRLANEITGLNEVTRTLESGGRSTRREVSSNE
jgi:non-ribosomal peptide synthetase component E (peptide arylation enzyme)